MMLVVVAPLLAIVAAIAIVGYCFLVPVKVEVRTELHEHPITADLDGIVTWQEVADRLPAHVVVDLR